MGSGLGVVDSSDEDVHLRSIYVYIKWAGLKCMRRGPVHEYLLLVRACVCLFVCVSYEFVYMQVSVHGVCMVCVCVCVHLVLSHGSEIV